MPCTSAWAATYASQPLVTPTGADGTLHLRLGQLGYTVLGQAYGKLKLFGQEFTGFRQLINRPEVNPQASRMTPNMFEAETLGGKLGNVSYFAGYVDKIKARNSDELVDVATVAGAPGQQGRHAAGRVLVCPGRHPQAARLRVPRSERPQVGLRRLLQAFSITDDIDLRIGGQLMVQGSTGTNLLAAQPFSTWAGGLDLDLFWGPLTLTAIYTQTGSAAVYRAPYGSWAGYTSMIVKDFNRANEGAFLLGAKLDLAFIKAPGFAITANAVLGNGAIDAATGAPLSTNNEYSTTCSRTAP